MSTGRSESLFDNSILPMVLLDMASVSIVEANRAAADFCGYSVEEMRGMPVSDIETMESQELKSVMARQLEKPVEAGRVLRHRLADGTLRDVDVRIITNPDPPGTTAYVVILDITAQQAAFRELDEHRARLETLLEESHG